MVVGDEDVADFHVADFVQQLFGFGGGVNNYSFVGFGANHDVAVVVVGAHAGHLEDSPAVVIQLAASDYWEARLLAFPAP